jgi:hypothetical protein
MFRTTETVEQMIHVYIQMEAYADASSLLQLTYHPVHHTTYQELTVTVGSTFERVGTQ